MKLLKSLIRLVSSKPQPKELNQTSTSVPKIDRTSLDFFNQLSGKLEIELSEPPERIGNLLNERAVPNATISNLRFNPEVFNQADKSFRALTSSELELVVIRSVSIKMCGESEEAVTINSPNNEFFTVGDLIAAVEETERQTRGNSEWFDGIDIHHCYFEGIYLNDHGIWNINWGS